MAGIPQNFAAISPVLPVYNFIDIAAGTGIINFYAGKTVDLNLLSNNTFYSNSLCTKADTPNGGVGAVAKVLDVDFDVMFNRPFNLAGKVVLNVPLAQACGHGAQYCYVIAKVRKYSAGGVESEVCENQSSTVGTTTIAPGTTEYDMLAIDLTVPVTHYGVGDYLRLTIEVWGYNTGDNSQNHFVLLGHDPMNRNTIRTGYPTGAIGWDTTGAVPSKLTFQVPVRVNL